MDWKQNPWFKNRTSRGRRIFWSMPCEMVSLRKEETSLCWVTSHPSPPHPFLQPFTTLFFSNGTSVPYKNSFFARASEKVGWGPSLQPSFLPVGCFEREPMIHFWPVGQEFCWGTSGKVFLPEKKRVMWEVVPTVGRAPAIFPAWRELAQAPAATLVEKQEELVPRLAWWSHPSLGFLVIWR